MSRIHHSVVASATLALLACSSEDSDEPATPAVPPSLSIESITAPAGQRWEPGSQEALRLDCSSWLVVHLGPRTSTVDLQGFLLQPPGDCGRRQHCGLVQVELQQNGSKLSETPAATPTVNIKLSDTGIMDGDLLVQAELLASDGTSFLLDAGVGVSASATLPVVVDCGASGSGGAGGTPNGG